MAETIQLGDIPVSVTRKNIKHVHLTVHPPDGGVTLVAPTATRMEVARAYAISKLHWIRKQQEQLKQQARETPRQFVERETHHVWGRQRLLTIRYEDVKPHVKLDHKKLTLTVRPGSDAATRAKVLHAWHKALLHELVPKLIEKWEPKLDWACA
jgi:predicted metal-dependent hydrolase